MQATPRQQRALAAICDTFVPGGDGVPAASDLGVPDALLELAGQNPRATERNQFKQLLGLWESRALTAIAGGGLSHFSDLPQDKRERVLLSWSDSRVAQRRAVFQLLRRAILLLYWAAPGDGRNPAWDAIGYPGPLGRREDAPPRTLEIVEVTGDVTLDCDVCVVGSGAGGGTAAGVLAAAGLDVVVLEAGAYLDEADFDGSEAQALTMLYQAAPGGTQDQSIALVAGACVGGGTTVNYSTALRTPPEVREDWAAHGVPAFTSEEYDASLDAVWQRLGVSQEYSNPSSRDAILQRAAVDLGWKADVVSRNVRGCDQGVNCGYCGLGCRLGAKQSTVKTWLADAQAAGAKIVPRTRAQRVIVEGGAARGVEARTADGHRVTVRSRAVVAGCGAIHTPALLKRSGLRNENIGRHLRVHPVVAVFGVYEEDLQPWTGAMQAIHVVEHAHLSDGYGIRYQTGPMQPHLFLSFAPWRGARQHMEMMRAFPYTSPIGALLRERDGGEIKVGRDGEPVVRYHLSDFDRRHLRAGLEGAARMHESAGARHIYSSHAADVSYRPGTSGSLEQFVAAADRVGYEPGRAQMLGFHLLGSARMGGSPATSACDPEGRTWEVRDLYVSDGSTFPTASGVNPTVSIEAIAHMNATKLAARLT